MVGKTNVGGGGKLFAVIAVTYPEGSVCTCTNGTKTLKAKDTSGKALFNVTVGEWTVSCTDGTNTASKAVSITAEGQNESVELNYMLYIFKSGSGIVNGFTFNTTSSGWYTITNDKINYNAIDKNGGDIGFSPKIDLSGYKTLKIELDITRVYKSGGSLAVGDNLPISYRDIGNTSALLSPLFTETFSRKTLSLDINDIGSTLYVKIMLFFSVGNVYNVWLE